MSKLLDSFKSYLDKMEQFNHVVTLLYWDMRTGTPKKGMEGHTEALTYFSTESFRLSTSDELSNMLDELAKPEEFEQMDDVMKFTVKRMKRDMDEMKNVPEDFYSEFINTQAVSENAWEEAKRAKDFSIFAPKLEKMIEMTKQMTAYTNPGEERYDAMLDNYEEGMDSATIDQLFDEMKRELVPMVKQITEAKQPDDSKFKQHFDKESQERVCEFLLDYIGFDKEKGNMAESEHPFTLNFSHNDARVTNHFYEEDPLSAIFSVIHEGGHAIFEQNVNPDFDKTAAASCCYMGLHESQSRFYENILGRNINFWKPIYGQIQKMMPQLQDISLEEFYHEINHVRNSFIRTEADELTYNFHIILRYEMEKAIFRDGVEVSKLPELWNQKMEEYLGITPENDAEGILQDMHWSDGSFGYFPSYLLGTIYDGMFKEKMQEDLGDLDQILAEGRIKEITKWLNENIHQYGSMRTPREVIQAVCGKEVTAEPIIRHFKEKYNEIYGL